MLDSPWLIPAAAAVLIIVGLVLSSIGMARNPRAAMAAPNDPVVRLCVGVMIVALGLALITTVIGA
jgi:hypothetical protein